MVLKLLLIDDDAAYAQLITKILEAHDFHVTYVPDVLMGLQQARELRPDLILIDMHLPDLAGQIVALQLCKFQVAKRIPLIAFTLDAGAKARRLALSFGCDDLITKPVDPVLFPQQLRQILANVTDTLH